MLNKIKKNIIPMLDTLGDALAQYLAQAVPQKELYSGVVEFIDAINAPIKDESEQVLRLSENLKLSLENPQIAAVENAYNEYCAAIESLPTQYKAVFLPYYDNTWDSLESVYEAFASDPMFVTEIVIIPIRRNTPHGWEIVYKDYLTPRKIPNTPFSSYSFETDLPDFVFYNNPYDGVNIEKFQSHNIKQYAGCMVFIPYYLYRHEFVKKDKLNKCVSIASELEGHNNCDIFVIQGNSLYRQYHGRSKNGGKMVVLGNPKTDNIYKNRTQYKRYPEWETIMSGKHTFLLNTHYSAVIRNFWKKWLPNLINYINENENLVMIWRPHPQSFLMVNEDGQSEWELMFHNLLDIAAKSERIILDRTESAVSAMMYSKAIISHNSSIIAEAIFMDKPILLLTPNISELLPSDRQDEYRSRQYMEKLKKIRKYDTRHLFLRDAVCYRGLNRPLKDDEKFWDYMANDCMFDFIRDIVSGIDVKKELRGLYREQLFVNREGNCGQSILNHVKGMIQN